MWHCDSLERQTDGAVVAKFVHPNPAGASTIRKVRYLGGQDGIPMPGQWYSLNVETGEFTPYVQAPTPPASTASRAPSAPVPLGTREEASEP